MKTRKNPESGVTLVELLISVALLGFVLLGIAPLFITSVKQNYSANEYTSIHNLARDRLEQLMNQLITSPQLAVGTYPNDLPPFLPNPTTGILPSTIRNPLSRTYTVSNWQSTPPATPGNPFTLTQVAAGNTYQFKRIDVIVTSANIGTGMGIGQRTAQVSGFIENTDPANILN